MEDRHSELDMSKVTRAELGDFLASRASCAAVDGAEFGVVQALFPWRLALFVHGLGVLDVTDAHVLDLFGREQAELDLLHPLLGRRGEGKVVVRHGCGCRVCTPAALVAALLFLRSLLEESTRSNALCRKSALMCATRRCERSIRHSPRSTPRDLK